MYSDGTDGNLIMCRLWDVAFYIQDQIIYSINQIEKLKISFIDSDSLQTGALIDKCSVLAYLSLLLVWIMLLPPVFFVFCFFVLVNFSFLFLLMLSFKL